MDSASENEDLGTSFLSDNPPNNHQYLLTDDGDDSRDADGDDDEDGDRTGVLREQDRFLPIANVARLMKKSIPKSGKIAKDARECVQECVSEFVSFITSEASDRCHQEKRKTINGEDILFAMQSLGFDNYVEPLKIYLQKYRESMKGEKPGGEGLDGTINLGDGTSFLMDEKADTLTSGLTTSAQATSTTEVKAGAAGVTAAGQDSVIFYTTPSSARSGNNTEFTIQ